MEMDERERTEDVDTGNATFADLCLSPPILRALTKHGYTRPSPVQLRAIPIARFGPDVVVQAKSGTGKTCVFAVVLLENVSTVSRRLQALVVTPTREIALQVAHVVAQLAAFIEPPVRAHTFIGGTSLRADLHHLRDCHIMIGTPGRIKALLEMSVNGGRGGGGGGSAGGGGGGGGGGGNGVVDASAVRMLVLDEADQLFADSFQGQVTAVMSHLPERRQTMVFSATYTPPILKALERHMRAPVQRVRVSADDPSLTGVKQFYDTVDVAVAAESYVVQRAKAQRLLHILARVPFHQCIVFTNDRGAAAELMDTLHEANWPAVSIGGDLPQQERVAAMHAVRTFKVRVLVSTDLTSRGVDVERISLVVNFDVPLLSSTYLHRVGRTGRFGTIGVAISFIANAGAGDANSMSSSSSSSSDDWHRLRRLQRRLRTRMVPLPCLDDIPAEYFSGGRGGAFVDDEYDEKNDDFDDVVDDVDIGDDDGGDDDNRDDDGDDNKGDGDSDERQVQQDVSPRDNIDSGDDVVVDVDECDDIDHCGVVDDDNDDDVAVVAGDVSERVKHAARNDIAMAPANVPSISPPRARLLAPASQSESPSVSSCRPLYQMHAVPPALLSRAIDAARSFTARHSTAV
jgi:ATP-dependent RNA helicase DDX20